MAFPLKSNLRFTRDAIIIHALNFTLGNWSCSGCVSPTSQDAMLLRVGWIIIHDPCIDSGLSETGYLFLTGSAETLRLKDVCAMNEVNLQLCIPALCILWVLTRIPIETTPSVCNVCEDMLDASPKIQCTGIVTLEECYQILNNTSIVNWIFILNCTWVLSLCERTFPLKLICLVQYFLNWAGRGQCLGGSTEDRE